MGYASRSDHVVGLQLWCGDDLDAMALQMAFTAGQPKTSVVN